MKPSKSIVVSVLVIISISSGIGILYISEDDSVDVLVNNDGSRMDKSEQKDFVFAFYSEIAENNEESNIFFSPLSISTAFSMAYEGADENTASEMRQVFGLESDDSKRQKAVSELLSRLNHKDDWYNLQVANALWIKDGYDIKQDYIDTAKTYYSSTVENVDFATDDGIDRINSWVVEKTNDKIQDILEPGSTDEMTLMAITNAVYFKGKWSSQFSTEQTTDKLFWTDRNNSVNIPMMRESAEVYNYAETDDLQALEMDYLGGDISMIVLLPKDRDGLESIEKHIDMKEFNLIKNSMTKQPLTLEMPKFEFETEYNLIEPLQNLGLDDAFDKDNADFQGIADEQIYLDQAKHKAFVNVSEEGTEAAAITALVFEFTSGPPEPRHAFVADHPFMFVIQEKETGEILFIGRIVNP
ncbi:MAG: serpin family protein [Nitrosopumilus sp.]|nr:serpin family protein [Nitrosopumilus sp.]